LAAAFTKNERLEYLNRLGNIIHKAVEVLKYQRRDGRTSFRSRKGTSRIQNV